MIIILYPLQQYMNIITVLGLEAYHGIASCTLYYFNPVQYL